MGKDGHLAPGELRPWETIVCCWVPVGIWCITLGPRSVKVSMSCAPSLPRESSYHSPLLVPGHLPCGPPPSGRPVELLPQTNPLPDRPYPAPSLTHAKIPGPRSTKEPARECHPKSHLPGEGAGCPPGKPGGARERLDGPVVGGQALEPTCLGSHHTESASYLLTVGPSLSLFSSASPWGRGSSTVSLKRCQGTIGKALETARRTGGVEQRPGDRGRKRSARP